MPYGRTTEVGNGWGGMQIGPPGEIAWEEQGVSPIVPEEASKSISDDPTPSPSYAAWCEENGYLAAADCPLTLAESEAQLAQMEMDEAALKKRGMMNMLLAALAGFAVAKVMK